MNGEQWVSRRGLAYHWKHHWWWHAAAAAMEMRWSFAVACRCGHSYTIYVLSWMPTKLWMPMPVPVPVHNSTHPFKNIQTLLSISIFMALLEDRKSEPYPNKLANQNGHIFTATCRGKKSVVKTKLSRVNWRPGKHYFSFMIHGARLCRWNSEHYYSYICVYI